MTNLSFFKSSVNLKKFASYAAIAIGSVGLIASITALKYCPSLPPLIAGGMIGSMLPLVACTLVGIHRSSLDKIYGNIYDQKKINEKAELFDKLSKCVLPLIAGAVVSFGVGAGLVALGVTSPIAITILTLIANAIVMQLVSKITERSSSPPIPPGNHPGPDSKTKCPSSPPPVMVGHGMRVDDANGHNPIDYQKERECKGKPSTERKCSTYATRKKPIDKEQGEKEYLRPLEEDPFVKELEDHFERISNLIIETESREQPDSSVDSGVKVNGASAGCVPSPSH